MGNPGNVVRPLEPVPPAWAQSVALFRSTLAASNLSPRYLDGSVDVIRRLAIAVERPPQLVTLGDLLERQNRGISPSSMAAERTVYRRFFGLLYQEGLIGRDPAARLPRVKVQRPKPRPLTVEQVELMLNGVPGGRPAYRRTRAMILLGALQGWRVAEIARARGEMFDLEAQVVRFVSKGSKEREQPLNPIVAALAATMPRRGYWFPAASGEGHVLPKSVSSMISNRISTVGIDDPRLSAHSLRHFYCTELVRAHVDIRVVAELAGHESVSTTMRYTEVDLTQQAAAVATLPTLQGSPFATALAHAATIRRLDDYRRASPTASRHGSRAAYRNGCRCDECRAAQAAANRRWRANKASRAG